MDIDVSVSKIKYKFIGFNVTCNTTKVLTNFVTNEKWMTSNCLLPFNINYTCCVIPYWIGDNSPFNCINIKTLQ